MNIWTLDKDISIKHLLLLVDGAIPALTYQLDTNDGLDSKAVRLTSNDASVSVYISNTLMWKAKKMAASPTR